MLVQFVSQCESLLAVFTVVSEGSRKMNVLYMVFRVSPLTIHSPAQGTTKLGFSFLHKLLNVFKEHFSCESCN